MGCRAPCRPADLSSGDRLPLIPASSRDLSVYLASNLSLRSYVNRVQTRVHVLWHPLADPQHLAIGATLDRRTKLAVLSTYDGRRAVSRPISIPTYNWVTQFLHGFVFHLIQTEPLVDSLMLNLHGFDLLRRSIVHDKSTANRTSRV